MKNLSDEALIAKFAQGENEAFDELLNRYKNKLFSYILTIVKNRDTADDIFQDTFTKVIVTIKAGQYSESGRFVGYLFRLAHNNVIDHFRRLQNDLAVHEGNVDYDLFNNTELADPSLEEVLSSEQVKRDIRRLIRFLPEDQKKIIRQRYYLDMSFKEIAELEGISINTALGRVRYAIINMRKMADKYNISLAV
jgi:RNA polymerase sigma-70 factor (ECF subfamily)